MLSQKYVPALVQTIRSAGLVLVADLSDEEHSSAGNGSTNAARASTEPPDGIDGHIRKDGSLKFHNSIEM